MGFLDYLTKSAGQRKTEAKTKLTKKAVKQTRSRLLVTKGVAGGAPPEAKRLAARDIATFPNPQQSKPRTMQLRKFR